MLGLTFSYDKEVFGSVTTVPFKPGGEDIDVTDANKHEYVKLYSHYKMTESIKDQIKAFQSGFNELIPKV